MLASLIKILFSLLMTYYETENGVLGPVCNAVKNWRAARLCSFSVINEAKITFLNVIFFKCNTSLEVLALGEDDVTTKYRSFFCKKKLCKMFPQAFVKSFFRCYKTSCYFLFSSTLSGEKRSYFLPTFCLS